MSSRAEHYREAERLLADTLDPTCVWEAGARERMIAAAHVRAQLSCMSDESYNDYLDLISSEHLREEVVHMPGQDSRDWLKGRDDDDPGPTHGYWEEGDLP
jgi:hypothetical protein